MALHQHLIEINEQNELYIYRLYENGVKDFLTKVDLPFVDGDVEQFNNFALMLGQNILFDSPIARSALSID